MTITTPPGHILLILRRLKENGHAAYLVGGCVRDAVMGRPMRDWDITTSAAPLDVARLFRDAVMIGAKFGTVTVSIPRFATATTTQKQPSPQKNPGAATRRREDSSSYTPGEAEYSDIDYVQVTTFRTEGEYLDGRHPTCVEFVATLDEDLSRRDFTINAMAATIKGRVIDLFGGLVDIKKRLIRCVGDPDTRIGEDALRMFRAYRFSAELGFDIESDSLLAIHANTKAARQISPERVRDELEKTLMSKRPEIISDIIECGLLDRYFFKPAENSGFRDNPDNLDNLKKLAYLPQEPLLRWCVFCFILLENGLIASAADILRDMHIDEKTVRNCETALTITDFPKKCISIKGLLAKHGIEAVRCAAAVWDTVHDVTMLCVTDEVIISGECFARANLAISGKDLIQLGYNPGPEMGKILDELLNLVIIHPDKNNREALLEALEKQNRKVSDK